MQNRGNEAGEAGVALASFVVCAKYPAWLPFTRWHIVGIYEESAYGQPFGALAVECTSRGSG